MLQHVDGNHGTEAPRWLVPEDLQGVALDDREPLPLAGRHHGRVAVDTTSIDAVLLQEAQQLAPTAPQLENRLVVEQERQVLREASGDLLRAAPEGVGERPRGRAHRLGKRCLHLGHSRHAKRLAGGQPLHQPAQRRQLLLQAAHQRVQASRQGRQPRVPQLLGQSLDPASARWVVLDPCREGRMGLVPQPFQLALQVRQRRVQALAGLLDLPQAPVPEPFHLAQELPPGRRAATAGRPPPEVAAGRGRPPARSAGWRWHGRRAHRATPPALAARERHEPRELPDHPGSREGRSVGRQARSSPGPGGSPRAVAAPQKQPPPDPGGSPRAAAAPRTRPRSPADLLRVGPGTRSRRAAGRPGRNVGPHAVGLRPRGPARARHGAAHPSPQDLSRWHRGR